ncbi:ImmA/IrrE family metallo-endopeptidase [Fibrella sp. WM1]|uniref:ImmA/IrrE family metallo-endopeptidase n=1 Tax=Fibrella musci TaxID=3242485 RepID=UPI0035216E3E
MTGSELAKQVMQRYGTSDVAELARRAGVVVRYERWHPVTLGEYHPKTRTICINLNASLAQASILAHELGHFFIHDAGLTVSRQDEETIAQAFAETLLRG